VDCGIIDASFAFYPPTQKATPAWGGCSDLCGKTPPYLHLDPDEIVQNVGGPLAVIDCFGILDDDKIRRYFELGCEVKGLGRGHVRRIKDEVRKKRDETLLNLVQSSKFSQK
jgi:hypothetical protein